MFALRRALVRPVAPAARSFHASPSVAKKAKHAAAEIEDFDVELEDDLFSSAELSEGPSSDRAQIRAQYANQIVSKNVRRIGELRKVIQFSDNEADLEGLEAVLRAWRVGGHRVTNKTAEELVGRCIRLGRPDLANKYAADRLTYGLPDLAPNMKEKLKKSFEEAKTA